MDEGRWLAERFEENRTQLRAVAYRMLGSVSEADDAVRPLRSVRAPSVRRSRALGQLRRSDPPTRLQEQQRRHKPIRSHRESFWISLGRIPAGPTLARFIEWMFALLQPLGIPDRVIAYLGDFMSLYLGAYGFEESVGVISPTGEEAPGGDRPAAPRVHALAA